MTINIENEYTGEDFASILPFDIKAVADKVVNAALDELDCPYEVSVSILLTDSEGIRGINAEMRDIDAETDVLSFPMCEYEEPGCFDHLEDDISGNFDPETGELLLGDIVLCVPRIRSQADQYGHSTLREYAFLIAHSLLHLTGFDHMVPEEEERMFALQEKILNSCGITRDAV